jgi:hypothetical protein
VSSRFAGFLKCLLLFAVVALTAVESSCTVFQTSIDVRVTSGSEFAHIVQLPGGSRPPDSFISRGNPSKFGWESRTEFRTVQGQESSLFIRVFQKDDGTYYYGDTAFELDSGERVQVRRATDQEWRRAHVVKMPDRIEMFAPMRDGKAVDDGRVFTFEGKQFKHSGVTGVFLLSPTGLRAVIFGLDRHLSNTTFGHEPFTYFVEAYDVASAQLIGSAQGYVNSNGLSIGQELGWVTDRYFYVPLDREHDKLLFFDFGQL